ncbi:hypothetical protein Y032_0107g3795 [Ancylostoma ceylanicum]|uniref:Thrombospondin type 1 domain protein n=1 Tax=Ancylostoma ceylanicum TaxID=53326 RepID=A0A016TFJ6_9BILA|nr:hypothetical protein Y032_0107g3795 [Ancylostoma ceylanicum]
MYGSIVVFLTLTTSLAVLGQEVTLTTILTPNEVGPTVNLEPPAENSATTAAPSPEEAPAVPDPTEPPTQATLTTVATLTTSATCAERDASWLAWSEWSTCSDECGSCGVHMRTRTCLTMVAGCTCPGDSTTIEYCNLEICRYPRTTCCYNLKVTSYNGRFACLENSTFNG